MPYGLHDDISYCQAEDGLIFLDVARDRYFRLQPRLERALVAHINGQGNSSSDFAALVDRRILVEAEQRPDQASSQQIGTPARSSVEKDQATSGNQLAATLEMMVVVLSLHWQLKRCPLKLVLNSVTAFRQVNAAPLIAPKSPDEAKLIEASQLFRRVRPFAPIEPICLLDSLALTQFLAKRNLRASIVFGVTSAPFSAHCWVQANDLVLNDTAGHANSYTQIRVV